MRLRLIRLRFRRRLLRGQKQVEDISVEAEKQIEQLVFRRFSRLASVRRFITGWVLLVILLLGGVITQNILLSGYFQALRPVPGGIYTEGVLGTFTTANPLYAVNDVDASVSRLLFSGLFTYGSNNQLVGDLASSYQLNSQGTVYTVHLRAGLTWQDGQPLTSADVAFTYHEIQNPDAQSPLASNWQDIIVTAPNPLTVQFRLPNPLASFPYNLTNGIIPEHILASVPASELRTADFNTVHPVGSGPFAWQAIQVSGTDPTNAEEQIALTPFAHFHAGKPKLQQFVVRAYASQDQLVQDFKTNQLTAIEGLNNVPSSLSSDSALQQHSFLLTAATMVFFKTSSGVLADQQVRQALVQSTNISQIVNNLGYTTHTVVEPLLTGQLAFNRSYAQPAFNAQEAAQILTQDGWLVGKGGVRYKSGQQLTFNLVASDTPEYEQVTKELQGDWRKVGVNMTVSLQDSTDFQDTLSYHAYDAILYGISIGVDPDVFVYWDSSQADPRSANRLNLSEWRNPTADDSLEAGRTRLDPALRVIKYQLFLAAWQQDLPAMGLYQPRLLYLTNQSVYGLPEHSINTATDRFNNVQNWEIREERVTN